MAGKIRQAPHSTLSAFTATSIPPVTSTSASQSQVIPRQDIELAGLGFEMPNEYTKNVIQGETRHPQHSETQSTIRSSPLQNTFPDSRPAITPRVTSLSAYQTLPSPTMPVSPKYTHPESRPTYTQASVSPGHGRDFSYELVEKAELQSPQVGTAPGKPHSGVHSFSGSAPSRPSRNPLRIAACGQTQGDGSPIAGPPSRETESGGTQMNRHPSSRTLVSPENHIPIVASKDGGIPSRNEENTTSVSDYRLQRNGSSQSAKTVRLAPLPTPNTDALPPNANATPFYVLRQIKNSMTSPDGAFIGCGLFLPCATWAQMGVKISAVETKVRIMELLSESLQGVRRGATFLTDVDTHHVGEGSHAAAPASEISGTSDLRAINEALDELEALTVETQKILAKKLGDGKSLAKPRKLNTVRLFNFMDCYIRTDGCDRVLSVVGVQSLARRWTRSP